MGPMSLGGLQPSRSGLMPALTSLPAIKTLSLRRYVT